MSRLCRSFIINNYYYYALPYSILCTLSHTPPLHNTHPQHPRSSPWWVRERECGELGGVRIPVELKVSAGVDGCWGGREGFCWGRIRGG